MMNVSNCLTNAFYVQKQIYGKLDLNNIKDGYGNWVGEKAKYLFGYTCTDFDHGMQIILHMYKVAYFSYR